MAIAVVLVVLVVGGVARAHSPCRHRIFINLNSEVAQDEEQTLHEIVIPFPIVAGGEGLEFVPQNPAVAQAMKKESPNKTSGVLFEILPEPSRRKVGKGDIDV